MSQNRVYNISLVLLHFIFALCPCCDSNKPVYDTLVKDLFTDYNPGVRPVVEVKNIIVGIAFGIIQLLDVGDKTKTVECVAYTALIWKDEMLSWNPADYNNISVFRYPNTKVWKPDIILINTPDLNEGPVIAKAATNVIIKSSGNISLEFTAVYKATCQSMDMTKFPFDHHECYFDFTSWTFTQRELDLYDATKDFDVTESMKLVPNAAWDITMEGAERRVEYDQIEKLSQPFMRIKFRLDRKPLYFLLNIILPITITCLISFLGMFSPSNSTGERTEKAFLGITTLLAIALLMLTVSAQMPVTSTSIPLIGYFLGVYIVTVAFAIVCTAVIMHIDVQGLHGRPLPKWVKWLFLEKIGKWLRIYYVQDEYKTNDICPTFAVKDQYIKPVETDDMQIKNDHKDMIHEMKTLNLNLERYFNISAQSQSLKEYNRSVRKEWSQLCTVLDRMCLIFFLTFSTVFTFAVLSN